MPGYTVMHLDELEHPWPKWILVRKSLGISAFGINVTELQPGEQIPEHDERDRSQEELFFALSGAPGDRDRRRRACTSRGNLRAPRPRAAPVRCESRRLGRTGADRVCPDDQRLRAHGLGLSHARSPALVSGQAAETLR